MRPYRSSRKTFQNTLLRSSASAQLRESSSKDSGSKNACCGFSSISMVSCRYSTVLVREPIIGHALVKFPPPIYAL